MRPKPALLPLIILLALSSTAIAQSAPADGYLPDEPHPQQRPASLEDLSLAAQPQPAVRGGMNLGIGVTIPTGGDLEIATGEREIRGTGDFGGGVHVLIREVFQIEFAVRGGFGGVDSDLYEETYGYEELGSRHIWLGMHARIMPVAIGRVRPFVSVLFGGDRVMAVSREPTGVYECEADGFVTTCREQTERTFAAGYWGRSVGFGGGLFVPLPGDQLALTVDVYSLQNSYGRRTVSEQPNLRLADPVTTWSVGTLILAHVILP